MEPADFSSNPARKFVVEYKLFVYFPSKELPGLLPQAGCIQNGVHPDFQAGMEKTHRR